MATNPLELLADLIACARTAGADAADAVLISGTSLGVQRRLGQTEHVERSEGRDLGLRVFLGQRAAIVSSSAIDPASFTELAERAVAMARVVPEDPYAGLADTAAPPEPVPLDLEDPAEPDTEALVRRASAAEEAALAPRAELGGHARPHIVRPDVRAGDSEGARDQLGDVRLLEERSSEIARLVGEAVADEIERDHPPRLGDALDGDGEVPR